MKSKWYILEFGSNYFLKRDSKSEIDRDVDSEENNRSYDDDVKADSEFSARLKKLNSGKKILKIIKADKI